MVAVGVFASTTACSVSDEQAVEAAREPAGAAVTYLFECVAAADAARQRPSIVTLGCASSGAYLDGLVWSDWGAPVAQADGRLVAKNCVPNCAEGKEEVTDVTVVASRLRNREATAVYKLLTVTITGKRTLGFDRTSEFKLPG